MRLANLRVLVTRAHGQSSALAASLEAEGAVPILIPTIEIAPPESWSSLDVGLRSLNEFDWLIFTSANAVESFSKRARELALQPHPKRIAVVGPATDRAVQTHLRRSADLIPLHFVAEALAESLQPHSPGSRMLLIRAAVAPDLLPDLLRVAGAHVTIAEAYRNLTPENSITALKELFGPEAAYPDAVTFTSASTARNLIDVLRASNSTLPETILRASIGPVTSRTLRDLGIPPHTEARESTIPALVDSLAEHYLLKRSSTYLG